jgi:hypothetical protein
LFSECAWWSDVGEEADYDVHDYSFMCGYGKSISILWYWATIVYKIILVFWKRARHWQVVILGREPGH